MSVRIDSTDRPVVSALLRPVCPFPDWLRLGREASVLSVRGPSAPSRQVGNGRACGSRGRLHRRSSGKELDLGGTDKSKAVGARDDLLGGVEFSDRQPKALVLTLGRVDFRAKDVETKLAARQLRVHGNAGERDEHDAEKKRSGKQGADPPLPSIRTNRANRLGGPTRSCSGRRHGAQRSRPTEKVARLRVTGDRSRCDIVEESGRSHGRMRPSGAPPCRMGRRGACCRDTGTPGRGGNGRARGWTVRRR